LEITIQLCKVCSKLFNMSKRQSFYFTEHPIRSDIPIPDRFPMQEVKIYVRSKFMPQALELIDIMEVGESILLQASIAIQVKRCLNYQEQHAKWYNAPYSEFILVPESQTYTRVFKIK
jgi:hypothetical protein